MSTDTRELAERARNTFCRDPGAAIVLKEMAFALEAVARERNEHIADYNAVIFALNDAEARATAAEQRADLLLADALFAKSNNRDALERQLAEAVEALKEIGDAPLGKSIGWARERARAALAAAPVPASPTEKPE